MAALTDKKKVGLNLTEGSILKTLIVFAIPIILTNLIQQLYSMIDLMVVGKYVGNIGSIGVNTGGEFADLVTPIATGLAAGGQIYISQLAGAKRHEEIKGAISTMLGSMMISAALLSCISIFFSTLILNLLNCPSNALLQARGYMTICALGFPFIFGYNAICSILRAVGESKRPLLFVIMAACINIVFDILLVVVFRLEAVGTAIATVLSQVASCVAALVYLNNKKEAFGFDMKLSSFKINWEPLIIILKLGIPQVCRSLLVRTGILYVNRSANSYGEIVSTTNGIGNKIQKMLDVFVSGIDTASAAMIGQNLGARNKKRAGKIVLYTWACALICAAGASSLCLFFPEFIFSLFSSDPAVIETGKIFLKFLCIHFFASATTGSFQSMVTGSGFVTLGFAIGILDGVICKIGFSYLFEKVFMMGYVGLFLAVATSRIIPSFINIGYYLSGKWKTRQLLSKN